MTGSEELKIEKEFKAKVAIREAHLKALPFGGLKSRASLAIVFSFYGFSDKVSEMLQELSHATQHHFLGLYG